MLYALNKVTAQQFTHPLRLDAVNHDQHRNRLLCDLPHKPLFPTVKAAMPAAPLNHLFIF